LPGSSTKKAFIDKIGQKVLQIGAALVLRHLEFVEEVAFDILERPGLFQLAPDARGYAVETIAMARVGIERDELIAHVC
jgi:hypothetical protein